MLILPIIIDCRRGCVKMQAQPRFLYFLCFYLLCAMGDFYAAKRMLFRCPVNAVSLAIESCFVVT